MKFLNGIFGQKLVRESKFLSLSTVSKNDTFYDKYLFERTNGVQPKFQRGLVS